MNDEFLKFMLEHWVFLPKASKDWVIDTIKEHGNISKLKDKL